MIILLNELTAQPVDDGNNYRTQESSHEVIYCKTFYDLRNQPEEKAVNEKREKAECEQVDRQGEYLYDRFDNGINKAKHCRHNKCGKKSTYMNAGNDIRGSKDCKGKY